jgi:hypothetical protein
MSEPEHRPAHLRPATVEISRFWPPDVALAVFELIDDLRDKILALHGDQLREALQASRGQGDPDESGDAADDGRPF